MSSEPAHDRERASILIPVFNDWAAASLLLTAIDGAVAALNRQVRVLLVDDASTERPGQTLAAPRSNLTKISMLRLRRNLGHQRAIAIGLAYLESIHESDVVVVMDGDGEDSPMDIPRLLSRFDELGGRSVVFGARVRRSESLLFTGFYHLYRLLHFLLTGVAVRVGNFSVLPGDAVSRLVVVSDLWNHFAASIFKARIPFDMVPVERRERLAGSSRMDFSALVTHGLSAISVFGERVGVRGIVSASGFLLITVLALTMLVLVRIFTQVAIPGWATIVAGVLLVLAVQLLASVSVFSFIVLASRDTLSFLPIRDFHYFVLDTVSVWDRESKTSPTTSTD